MRPTACSVGELAKRTGVTVRTLRYYEEIGLIAPPRTTNRATASTRAAMSPACSRSCRSGNSASRWTRFGILSRPISRRCSVIEMHIARAAGTDRAAPRLVDRLEAIASSLRRAEKPSVTELLHTMEVMNRMEKYYTPEQ